MVTRLALDQEILGSNPSPAAMYFKKIMLIVNVGFDCDLKNPKRKTLEGLEKMFGRL